MPCSGLWHHLPWDTFNHHQSLHCAKMEMSLFNILSCQEQLGSHACIRGTGKAQGFGSCPAFSAGTGEGWAGWCLARGAALTCSKGNRIPKHPNWQESEKCFISQEIQLKGLQEEKKKRQSHITLFHTFWHSVSSKPKCHTGQQELACPDPLAFSFKVQCCDRCGALSPAALTPADHALWLHLSSCWPTFQCWGSLLFVQRIVASLCGFCRTLHHICLYSPFSLSVCEAPRLQLVQQGGLCPWHLQKHSQEVPLPVCLPTDFVCRCFFSAAAAPPTALSIEALQCFLFPEIAALQETEDERAALLTFLISLNLHLGCFSSSQMHTASSAYAGSISPSHTLLALGAPQLCHPLSRKSNPVGNQEEKEPWGELSPADPARAGPGGAVSPVALLVGKAEETCSFPRADAVMGTSLSASQTNIQKAS